MLYDWTKTKIALLRKLYPKGKNADLEKIFGLGIKTIRCAAKRYQIKKLVHSNDPWTAKTEARLVKLYPNMRNIDIAIKLGVTESAVMAKAFKLRLFKNPAFKYKCSKKGMFKKGSEPVNKGKTWSEFMSKEGMLNSRKTQFKKGNVNHNSKHDGVITIREHKGSGVSYKWIRISKSKWVPLHRYNWEKKHGPVPKGHIVVFKDPSNTMDCRVSKLELITMEENMTRNSASVNLSDGYIANCLAWRNKEVAQEILQHKPLIELKRQQLILKRTIHEQSTIS